MKRAEQVEASLGLFWAFRTDFRLVLPLRLGDYGLRVGLKWVSWEEMLKWVTVEMGDLSRDRCRVGRRVRMRIPTTQRNDFRVKATLT